MKKILINLIIILLLVLLYGCTNSSKNTDNKLYIYNWTYYIPDQVIKDFETKYNVKVVYDVYTSNEEMYAKLKAGGAKGYDLVFPSGDFVKIMISSGMLSPIDSTKIASFNLLDPLITSKIAYDPGLKYSFPYMVGAAGISVNKKYIKKFSKSARIFENTALKNKMTLLDDMREVLGLALKELGYSVNTFDKGQLEEAKQLVLKWKQNIVKFDAESFGKGFAAGEFWVVHGYSENVFLELDPSMKAQTEFFIPPKGGPMYIDSMVILKDSKHKDLAYKFINFIHEPQVYAKIVDYLKIPAINMEARKFVTVSPNYNIIDLKNCELKEDLGEGVELYNKIWEEIRI
ncbi:MAG: spermidine/putrescine ABC transporter substrate-binding protein [Candidatus Margulisbacteria bacterium GWF2_35_9]|nr:MAG: spermidine/putrescine ABC transporter substrate-binding protein [Candidatus Margulisbacteria bacterium GWF2_35_9]